MYRKIVLFIVCCLHLTVIGYAQQVSFSGKDVSLKKIFQHVEKETGYFVVYEPKVLEGAKFVTIEAVKMGLEEFLGRVLKGQGLRYWITGTTVTVVRAGNKIEEGMKGDVVRGRVVNEKGESVEGVTVTVKGSNRGTTTNVKGEFVLDGAGDVLVFSGVSIEMYEVKVEGREDMNVRVKSRKVELEEVAVVSTGYEKISPERTTGAYAHVNNSLYNRRVSTNILDRIDNLVSGISFNNPNDGILIRGRSSIYSNVAPLIVIDNFPYDGNINNINPNDVEEITILKDAGAASIWGARAGNGVIVITTKRGKGGKTRIDCTSNVIIQQKPDLFNISSISSSDFIELEKFLFEKGLYNGTLLNRFSPQPLTPVVEILAQKRDGNISTEKADQLINAMKNIDARDDLEKYFYKNGLTLQNSMSVSGSNNLMSYYFSIGYDRIEPTLKGAINNRITLRSQNNFRINSRLSIDFGVNLTQMNDKNGQNLGMSTNSGSKSLYPYADLVDSNGDALRLVRQFRNLFVDTIGGGRLLDWKYYPYDEINYSKTRRDSRDNLLNLGIKYLLTDYLSIDANYQFEASSGTVTSDNTINSYTTRDLINKFYQPNSSNKYPVPLGSIYNFTGTDIASHQARVQLSLNKSWSRHIVTGIAGWEIKDLVTKGNAYMLYGYNEEGSAVKANMDFVTRFPQFYNPFIETAIPNSQSISKNTDRFISYYLNGSYTYDKRLVLSASARQDAANLFGVKTNQKGVPLWSGGFGWIISNEKFYRVSLLPYLKLRATYGYNGNFSRSASGILTIAYDELNSLSGFPMATVLNPKNENLRWEQVRVFNIGLDFKSKDYRIMGSVEYFKKNAKDLMALAPADPTLGINIGLSASAYFSNIASMKGDGYEIELNTENFRGKFSWQTKVLFSSALNKVSEYLLPVSKNSQLYLFENNINPIIGKPVYSMFSYAWGGLDPINGDPIGYRGKEKSKNYTDIMTQTRLDSLVYSGPVQPKYWGSVMNTFAWGALSVSANISFVMGYYFRRSTINYTNLVGTWAGHGDYGKRWQKSGDENYTTIPSFVYPVNGVRDDFYRFSEILIEKGDHIRFKDIRINYAFTKDRWKGFPLKSANIYLYISNIGLIWTANKEKIDPQYNNNSPRERRSYSFGLNLSF